MDRLERSEFDAVIVGTGLSEALLAAALALAGSSVLHLDPNSFYGASCATLPLAQIDRLASESLADRNAPFPPFPSPSASLSSQIHSQLASQYRQVVLRDVPQHARLFPHALRPLHLCNKLDPSLSNHFFLDIIPRPVMAAGSLVQLMIKTNVGHYIDFRPLQALYVEFGGPHRLQPVPASRADVFQNKFVSMLEKRLLMRFVKKCHDTHHDQQQHPDTHNHTFQHELSAMQLTTKLQTFLTQSIAFCTDQQQRLLSNQQGVARVATYQQSMAKFATKTPFLVPNYGSGELAQAFCRLCAVHGGVYMLRRAVAAMVTPQTEGGEEAEAEKVGLITSQNELIVAKKVFVGAALASSCGIVSETAAESSSSSGNRWRTWRLMGVIDRSIVNAEGVTRVMVTVPKGVHGNEQSAVRIRQLDSSVMICPQGYFVLYAETVDGCGDEVDVLAATSLYVDIESFDSGGIKLGEVLGTDEGGVGEGLGEGGSAHVDRKARLLWGVSYATDADSRSYEVGNGVVVVGAPSCEIDAEQAIDEAKTCFRFVHGGEEFFRTDGAGGGTGGGTSEMGNGAQDQAGEDPAMQSSTEYKN